jgi:hypothetical protein
MLVTRMAEGPFYLSIATYYEGKFLLPTLPNYACRYNRDYQDELPCYIMYQTVRLCMEGPAIPCGIEITKALLS